MDTSELFVPSGWQTPISSMQTNQDTFADRSQKLFDQLKKAEEQTHSEYIFPNRQHVDDNRIDHEPQTNELQSLVSRKRKRSETRQFRGQESIFKRPEAPLSRCLPPRRLAGFQRNPDKWVKYTLEDVSNDDLTNTANTAAALTFLREMEDRKTSGQSTSSVNDQHERVMFKNTKRPKPGPTFSVSAIISSLIPKDQPKPSFRSSKVIMPEYVVGQKDQRDDKKKPKEKPVVGKQLRLDHLLEEEGDDEEK